MPNPFDQFDAPKANPFDQFDDAVQPSVSPTPAQPLKTSQALGFYEGVRKPLDNLAVALETLAGHLGIDTNSIAERLGMPTAAQAKANVAQEIETQKAQGVEPGGIGKFAGEVVGTLPTLAVSSNPIAAGAMSGALLTDKQDVGGVLTDAAVGGVAGKVGDVAVKGLQRVVAPKINAAAQSLMSEGVELTPGQIAGGVAKRVEDSATSVPVVGDAVKSAQRKSLETFNRAAVNRTLKPIGESLPDNVPLGNDAVAYAGDKLDNAYSKLLPTMSVVRDGRFEFEMSKLKALAAQGLPEAAAKQVGGKIDEILSGFSSMAGKMTGQTMKGFDSDLGRLAREYRRSSVASERLTGDAYREMQSILRDVVQRSNPAKRAQLKAIDRGYANLLRVENAASKAKDGIFTPGQLQTATRVMDSSLRKRQSARGTALMQDLAKAGREVLPSSVPDSGTPTRLITNILAGGGLGYLEPNALAAGLGATAVYTRPGQNAMRFLMTRRPQGAEEVADYLARLKAPAAVTGASLSATE